MKVEIKSEEQLINCLKKELEEITKEVWFYPALERKNVRIALNALNDAKKISFARHQKIMITTNKKEHYLISYEFKTEPFNDYSIDVTINFYLRDQVNFLKKHFIAKLYDFIK